MKRLVFKSSEAGAVMSGTLCNLLVAAMLFSAALTTSCNKDEKTVKYTVKFDANGGIPAPADQKVREGETVTEPPKMTKADFKFDGWYRDAEKWNFATDTVTADMTLKAVFWELSVSPRTIGFEYEPDTTTVSISSNVNWTVTVRQAEQWVKVEPTEGKGNAELVIAVLDNPDFEIRYATIIIEGEGVNPDSIIIQQIEGIDIANKITDPVFKKYCFDDLNLGTDDGRISLRKARSVKILRLDKKQITSLAGIEYFTELVELLCDYNNLEKLDLSKNINLKKLNCNMNKIEKLDLSSNTELIELVYSYNPITNLNINGCKKLRELNIITAELKTIDLSTNIALEGLQIANNQIKELDLSNNPKLSFLLCNANELTNLNLKNNPELHSVYCGGNKLTSIDITSNPKLVALSIDGDASRNENQITSGTVDLSKNEELLTFSCRRNKLTSLNTANNKKLTQLNCDGNQLTKLELGANTKMITLTATKNNLTGDLYLTNFILVEDNGKPVNIEIRLAEHPEDPQNPDNPNLKDIYVPKGFCIKSNNSEYIFKPSTARWQEDGCLCNQATGNLECD